MNLPELLNRGSLAIQFSAGCSNVSNVCCFVALILLLHYFNRDSNNVINFKMKLFGLLPILTSIILNTWFGMLGNNSIWASINDKFPFIDEYCLESMRFVLVVAHIDLYAVSIFILMRTYHFFNTTTYTGTTDEVKVNSFVYYIFIFVLSTIATLYCIISMTISPDVFQVTIYHHKYKHKQCELSFNSNQSNNILPFLAISQTLLQFCLVILCLKKLINFNQFIAKQGNISKHYSGKIPESNIHIVTRFLSLSITFIVAYWLSFVILSLYQWSFFPCAIIVKASIIVSSFDITKPRYVLSVNRYTYQNNNLSNKPKIYEKIATNDCMVFVDNKIEYSISSTIHSEIDNNVSKNEYLLKWSVNNKFKKDCLRVYNILLSMNKLNIPPLHAQIISEYACTQYLHCVKCFMKYGYIECHLDYDYANNVGAVVDEYDNVRYYLDTETSQITECDLYNTYDESMEILCVKCSTQWKCLNCNNMLSTSVENITNECIVCKALICEMCVNSLLCELSVTDGGCENTENTYVLCKDCFNNDEVTGEQISTLVKEMYSGNRETSLSHKTQSDTNKWSNWNFGSGEW